MGEFVMAMSNYEKQQVVNALDTLDDLERKIVLATLQAFADWLSDVLYIIYLKVKDVLRDLWKRLCSEFL